MKKLILASYALAIACLAYCDTPPPETGFTVASKVTLSDGSQIAGTPLFADIALVTSFGKHRIPLKYVASLDLHKDGAKIGFANKDVLSGTLGGESFRIATIFGEVTLAYAQIRKVSFATRRNARGGAEAPGLLLHAVLDSEDEDLAAFDARMKAQNVRIVDSPTGKGMLLETVDAKLKIQLPFSPYAMSEGTIEFWAKLPKPYQSFLSGGGQPFFFNITTPALRYNDHFLFGFCGNDGNAKAGLIGRAFGIVAGTHPFGSVNTISATGLLDNAPDGWHHYAFIWKRDGVDFPTVAGKQLVFTIDGKIVASNDRMVDNLEHYRNLAKDNGMGYSLDVHDEASDCSRPIAISDIKIWDYAKLPTID